MRLRRLRSVVLGSTWLITSVTVGCSPLPSYVFPDESGPTATGAEQQEGATSPGTTTGFDSADPNPADPDSAGPEATGPDQTLPDPVGTTSTTAGTSSSDPTSDSGTTSDDGAPRRDPAAFCRVDLGLPDLDSDCVPIGDRVFTWSDDGGVTRIDDVWDEDQSLCFGGRVGQVLEGRYDVTYGAGMGIMMANEVDGVVVRFDAQAQGIRGVQFALQALPAPHVVRFEVTAIDPATGIRSTYCSLDAPLEEGENRVWFDQLYLDCWQGDGPALDVQHIEAIQWHVVTNAESGFPFDVCVSELRLFK